MHVSFIIHCVLRHSRHRATSASLRKRAALPVLPIATLPIPTLSSCTLSSSTSSACFGRSSLLPIGITERTQDRLPLYMVAGIVRFEPVGLREVGPAAVGLESSLFFGWETGGRCE